MTTARAATRSRSTTARRALFVLCSTSMLACGCRQPAERLSTYPARPIRIVVPFAAGGGTDLFARVIEEAIERNRLLPQPLLITNVDGAGGTIGSRRVKNAKPDGYTVLLLHDAIVTARYAAKAPYGPEAFVPVAATGELGLVLAAAPSAEWPDLAALMRSAPDDPDSPTFAANLGAPSHFAGLRLEASGTGVSFRFVQIGGGAKRFAALTGGHIQLSVFSIAEYVRFRAGGLRGLAYLGDDRHPAAPSLQTAREQRVDVTCRNLFVWWMPRGTPDRCVTALADALERAMSTDFARSKLAEMHCDPVFLRGGALESRIDEMVAEYASVAPRRVTAAPPFPGVVAGVCVCLMVLLLPRAWRRLRQLCAGAKERARVETRDGRLTRMVACILATALYAAAIGAGWPGFRVATALYVLGLGGLLADQPRRQLPAICLVALSLAFGLHVLLTRFLVVDLY